MYGNLKNEKAIREYLLGRISDEALLAKFDELLFLDEEFCTLAEIAEDDLINDFVFERLNETDTADFAKALENNRERREKIAITRAIKEKAFAKTTPAKETKSSFFDSIATFFRQPLNAGAFAVVLVAIFATLFLLINRQNDTELAELRSIYKKERPTESRISEFEYAPLVVTRGAGEEREKNKLRRIEISLLESVEKDANATELHALGVFLLTQRKFEEAISELEKAAKLDEKNATISNDLGSAYFEKAKTAPDEKKLETLAKALENFSQAVESDSSFLPALFNKSLCLQQLRLYNQAKDAWNLYLEKDATSGWSEEARKNLERLEQLKSKSKTNEQVLEDFLEAYRNGDEEMAWKINSQTREMISGVWLPDQLSRRFLESKIRGDDATGSESIEALKFIGNLEKTRNADFFVAELADYYLRIDAKQIENLQQAKNLLSEGYKISTDGDNETAKATFIKASGLFADAGNLWENQIAEHWIAFSDGFLKNLAESNERFLTIEKFAVEKKYRWLQAVVLYRLSTNFYYQNKHSESLKYDILSEKIVSEIGDSCGQRLVASETAASFYEIGEIEKALEYSGKAIFAENSYYESVKQTWRNQTWTSKVLGKTVFFNSSLQFALEDSQTARLIADKEYFYDSLKSVALSFVSVKDFDKALNAVLESLQIAESFSDKKSKEISLAKSFLLTAQIKRLAGNCEEALTRYDEALKFYADFKEEKVDKYKIHKGKLQCYQQLGQTRNLQNELEIVRDLLEKYRSEIVEEENRNVFFDKEHSVADIAVEFELVNNNPAKAFANAEEAKARSLLDFMQGEVSFEKSEIRFASVTKNLSLAEIQKRMSPHTQIVEYAVLPDKITVWIIKKKVLNMLKSRSSLTI